MESELFVLQTLALMESPLVLPKRGQPQKQSRIVRRALEMQVGTLGLVWALILALCVHFLIF